MGLTLNYTDGQTPLEEEERERLLIPNIATRSELDEFEQLNIEKAIQWSLRRNFKQEYILVEEFVLALHKRMYSDVWAWAGSFRKTNKNLGVDKLYISVALRTLLDDTLYWIVNRSFDADEIAVRCKHRMVSIHCFVNGNGRHSRLMADIIIQHIFQMPVFTWGASNLMKNSDARKTYLLALKAADIGNYDPLKIFARS